MSTEVATISNADAQQIAQLLGASEAPAQAGDRLPVLKVNSMRKDASGRKIPEGEFYLKGDGIEAVYAETVSLRVLSQLFQWLHYDPEENRVKNKTLLIPNFRHEARDMLGTLRCGKPTSAVLREASKDEQKKYADIKCFRQLRALVSYTGKDADGTEVKVENQPCILLLKGSNFSPFEDEFAKAIPRGANLYDYNCDVSAEELQNGSVVYYVMHFKPQLKAKIDLDDDTLHTMFAMAQMIKGENEKIDAGYQKSMRQGQLSDDAIDSLAEELEDALEV